MFSRRALPALGIPERQWLWSQRQGSGQCARCFHASLSSREGESTTTIPYNAPNQSETRKQRSTRISSEIAMLNKGPPPSATPASIGDMKGPGSARGAFHAPPEAPGPGSGFVRTPNEIGDAGKRMGENESTTREGPRSQLGRMTNTAEGMIDGAEANPRHHENFVERAAQSEDIDHDQGNHSPRIERQRSLDPSSPQRLELLHGGYGASTIADGNFRGVIRDRVKAVAISGSPDAEPRRILWSGMKPKVRKEIVDKLVRGEYEVEDDSITGKSRVLKDVARVTSLNGSYLPHDRARVLKKVRSLLPASMIMPKEQQQQQQQSKPVRK